MVNLVLLLQFLTLPVLAGLVLWLVPSIVRDVTDSRMLQLRLDVLDAADRGEILEGAARELLNGVEKYLGVQSMITLPLMVYFRVLERAGVVPDLRVDATPSAGDLARLYVDTDSELERVVGFERRFEDIVGLRAMLGSLPSVLLLPFFAGYLVLRRLVKGGGRRAASVRDFVKRELPSVEASPMDRHRYLVGG